MTLKTKIKNGILWQGSSDVIRQLLQIAFTIVLARLLNKSDFGLVAMALVVNRFAKAIIDFGFGAAIIHNQNITKAQISAIFYLQLLINTILTTVVFFGAYWAALFFEEPQLEGIVKYIAFIILLQTFQFPQILLTKELNFRSISIADITSLLISNIIAIGFAFSGFGLWSLIIRLFIQTLVIGILVIYFSKFKLVKPSFSNLKGIFKFGFHIFFMKIFSFTTNNLINILTGKFLGSEILGLFNIAYNISIEPASKIKKVITSVLTPVFSRLQNDFEKFKSGYTQVLSICLLLFTSLMMMLSSTSDNLIYLMYGVKWLESAIILKYLAFVGLFFGISHILRSSMLAIGKSVVMMRTSILSTVISLPVMFFLLEDFGVYGLIAGYLLGALASLLYESIQFNYILKDTFLFFRIAYKPILLSSVIFLINNYLNISIVFLSKSMIFAIQCLMSLVIFICGVYLLYKELFFQILNKLKLMINEYRN